MKPLITHYVAAVVGQTYVAPYTVCVPDPNDGQGGGGGGSSGGGNPNNCPQGTSYRCDVYNADGTAGFDTAAGVLICGCKS